MTEEEYAKLLALSAKQTNIAIESSRRAIEGRPPLRRFVNPFCEIRKENNHNVEVFLQEFSNLSGITIDILLGKNRTGAVSDARNILFYVMYKHIGFTTPKIARIFQRDVSTIGYGKVRGETIISKNKFLVQLIDEALKKSRIDYKP